MLKSQNPISTVDNEDSYIVNIHVTFQLNQTTNAHRSDMFCLVSFDNFQLNPLPISNNFLVSLFETKNPKHTIARYINIDLLL
jgi:hypothetical protein